MFSRKRAAPPHWTLSEMKRMRREHTRSVEIDPLRTNISSATVVSALIGGVATVAEVHLLCPSKRSIAFPFALLSLP